jgi:hypothetical protein
MRYTRFAASAVLTGMLALPATALGHGSVYTDTARVDTDPDPGELTMVDRVRHMVTNHGFTLVLRETNGASTEGMVDYSRLPGDYRSGLTMTQLLSEGDTAAQPHATCRGVAALESEAAITGWQGPEPFYNYIPFQKASAGLEDDPAYWIGDVQALTGVDLAQVSDDPAIAAGKLQTLCSGEGGTFVAADQTQSTAASLASGTVEQGDSAARGRDRGARVFDQPARGGQGRGRAGRHGGPGAGEGRRGAERAAPVGPRPDEAGGHAA